MQELFPFAFAGAGQVLDNIVTNLYCSRFGTKSETGWHGKLMEKYGIWESSIIAQAANQSIMLGIGAGAYVVDRLFHTENQMLNLHHIWLFMVGSMPYLNSYVKGKKYISALEASTSNQ